MREIYRVARTSSDLSARDRGRFLKRLLRIVGSDCNARQVIRSFHSKVWRSRWITLNLPVWASDFVEAPGSVAKEACWLSDLLCTWLAIYDDIHDSDASTTQRPALRACWVLCNAFYTELACFAPRALAKDALFRRRLETTLKASNYDFLPVSDTKRYLSLSAARSSFVPVGLSILSARGYASESYLELQNSIKVLSTAMQIYDDLVDYDDDQRRGQANFFVCRDVQQLSLTERVEFAAERCLYYSVHARELLDLTRGSRYDEYVADCSEYYRQLPARFAAWQKTDRSLKEVEARLSDFND